MLFKSLQSISQNQTKVQKNFVEVYHSTNQSINSVALLDNNNVGLIGNNCGNNVLGVLSKQNQ
ncbi:hypothetical protein DICPUDRAFT_157613 [Dictyostelium purpureum]|uniref:Uncharacterized protein n=1 Tax=Dictyostelium purpureum TaxID=5786 RepID=F0ZZL1_DICPU|nr:uncharacterized protein DICPUDRAFT_157613 [Dictyostelium purpureum]EGC30613.1 hypothetical protein DICPUDRAFT_157613 [Dictyostelium purpureum]|eukprot:XP_003292848.1 hypothetical protein DICPUDRAFT_157613 [Dictyostelium purpureum]